MNIYKEKKAAKKSSLLLFTVCIALGSAMQYSTEKVEATAVVERHQTQVSMSELWNKEPTLTKIFSPPNFLSFLHFYKTYCEQNVCCKDFLRDTFGLTLRSTNCGQNSKHILITSVSIYMALDFILPSTGK